MFPQFSRSDVVSFAVAAAVCIAFLIWSGHLIRRAHREIGLPEPAAGSSPLSTEVSGPGIITTDVLHVTSISLGKVRLAVVNGQRVAEGDSLEVKTSAGTAMLRGPLPAKKSP